MDRHGKPVGVQHILAGAGQLRRCVTFTANGASNFFSKETYGGSSEADPVARRLLRGLWLILVAAH